MRLASAIACAAALSCTVPLCAQGEGEPSGEPRDGAPPEPAAAPGDEPRASGEQGREEVFDFGFLNPPGSLRSAWLDDTPDWWVPDYSQQYALRLWPYFYDYEDEPGWRLGKDRLRAIANRLGGAARAGPGDTAIVEGPPEALARWRRVHEWLRAWATQTFTVTLEVLWDPAPAPLSAPLTEAAGRAALRARGGPALILSVAPVSCGRRPAAQVRCWRRPVSRENA